MSLPDTRAFTVPADFLNAWCAAQPERDTHDLVADLASYAGCSWTHMRHVLSGDRDLPLDAVAGLVKGLNLPLEQAEHLRRVVEFQNAPTRGTLALRQQVWAAFAATHGLAIDSSSALLGEVQPSPLAEAALAPALATLEDGLPSPKSLVKCAVVPVVHANVEAASPNVGAWRAHRVAPRMITLPPPGKDAHALITWQGLLGWAREALVRLPADQRTYRTFTASVDEAGLAALQELVRGFQARLVSLAEDAELLPEERVVGVLIELLPLAGPMVGGDGARVWRWQRPDITFPKLDGADDPAAGPLPPPGEEPMPPLAGHIHFPTWLKLWKEWRARRGEEHSDGYLARRTGLSRPTVHDLGAGTVAFGSQHVPLFLKAMKLEDVPHAGRGLECMALINARHHPEHQAKLIAAQRSHGLAQGVRLMPTEAHFAQSRWHVWAVFQLAELASFQAVPGWVSRALAGRITWAAAEEALVVLGHLGLLAERSDGVVVPVEPKVRLQGPHADLALFELHDGVMRLLQSEVGFGDVGPEVHGSLLALPERAMPRLWRLFDAFRDEVRAAFIEIDNRHRAGEPTSRVIQLSWQCFQAFRFPIKKKRRG